MTLPQKVAIVEIMEMAKCHRDFSETEVERNRWSKVAQLAYEALGKPSMAKVDEIRQKAPK